MAANPFDQFDAPQANPFDQFDAPAKTPAPAAPPGQDLGTTALWNKPADTSWNDYLMAHLAKPFQGADQAAQDYSRTAVNAATFGQGDRLQAYLTGNPLAQERAQTAAAGGRLGAMAPIVQGAMYAMGPGSLGMAKGIAADLAPAGSGLVRGALANAAGSAAEGASANYLGALGHGASPGEAEKQGLQGAVIGAPIGALSEGAGRMFAPTGPKPPEVGQPQSSTGPATGMYAQKTAEYAPLDSLVYDTHGDAINQAQSIIRASRDPHGVGVDLGIPQDVNDIVAPLQQSPVVSGRNLQEASRDLRATGDWTGHRFADQFDSVLKNDDPLKGGDAGEGWDAKQAGDNLYGRINDLERLAKESLSGAAGPDAIGGAADEGPLYALTPWADARS